MESEDNGAEKESLESKETEKEKESKTSEAPTKKKIFHKTTSIFLRNLPPTITKSEVEAVILGRFRVVKS